MVRFLEAKKSFLMDLFTGNFQKQSPKRVYSNPNFLWVFLKPHMAKLSIHLIDLCLSGITSIHLADYNKEMQNQCLELCNYVRGISTGFWKHRRTGQ